MRFYSVKELAKLSGVSVRTLHYYDNIDLLKPFKRTEAGYRCYGESELLRLQQILFYKELGLPLKDIQELLNDPGFDLIEALEGHKLALAKRKERISKMLATIDKTILNLKKGKTMTNPEELYEGLPKEMGTTYRKEAIEKYGKKTIEKAETNLLNLGKEGFKQLQKEFEQVTHELFTLRQESPQSHKVQQQIRRHYVIIRKFWGTANSPDNQAEAYAGLGNLYVHDERYTSVDGKPQPEFAAFMQKAMRYFADTQLK